VKGYGPDGLSSIPGMERLSLFHSVHTGSEPHRVAYPMFSLAVLNFPGSEVAQAAISYEVLPKTKYSIT
jgi:hypothetical protein